jgi:serine/threonine protein kinase
MAELDGTRVGNYQIRQRIGSGGMGDVYLAEQASLGRLVVIKVMRADTSLQSDAKEQDRHIRQFMQEARAIASLDHPHILPLYDYGEEGHIRYLVMAYVPDGSLADMLSPGPSQRLHLPLPPPFVAEMIMQTGEALQFAHDRGIIHRDVKPGNLLIQLLSPVETGQPEPTLPRMHVFLADFGLARFLREVAEGTSSVGTPLYTAPEQYQGHPVPATDQYSLACVAYLLLCGQPVFGGTVAELYHQHLSVQPRSATLVNALLPPAVDTPLRRALAKVPEQRFPRIIDFALALNATVVPASLTSRPLAFRATPATSSFSTPRQSARQVTGPPDPLSTDLSDGSPAPLPVPRSSQQRSALAASSSPGQPAQKDSPAGVVQASSYSDAPGAPLPSRSPWRKSGQSWRAHRRHLIIGGAAMLVVILLAGLGFAVTQNLHTATGSNGLQARIERTGSVDFRQLFSQRDGIPGPGAGMPLRLSWNQAQAAEQASAADHLSALPVLPESAPELAAVTSSTFGKLPEKSAPGLGESGVGAPAPLDISIASNGQFIIEAVDGAVQIVGLGLNQPIHAEVAAAGLFKPVLQSGDTLGEPRVFFDSTSHQWITVINELHMNRGEVSAGFFDVAISRGDQPLGTWSVYRFSTVVPWSSGAPVEDTWADDPQIGNDSQAFYISGNLFAMSPAAPLLGSVIFDLPKREFSSGRATVGTSIYILTGFANQQKMPVLGVIPAQTNGAVNTEWLISNDAGYVDGGRISHHLIVWAITNPGAVNSGRLPSLVGVVLNLPIAYADPPMPIQKGSARRQASGDARFADVYFAAGHLCGAFTTAVNWRNDSMTRAGIYWFDLVPTLGGSAIRSPVSVLLANTGIYGFAQGYMFHPVLIPNPSGDLALLSEATSPRFYPGLVYAARRSTDPANQIGSSGKVLVVPGRAPVAESAGSAWVDYIGGCTSLSGGGQSSTVWEAGAYQGTDSGSWQTLLWQVQPGGMG